MSRHSRRSPDFSSYSRTTLAGASRMQTGPHREEKQVYSVQASQPRATTTPPLAPYVEVRSSGQFKSVVARALATAPTVGNREHPESQAPSNRSVFTVKTQQPTCQREFASNSPPGTASWGVSPRSRCVLEPRGSPPGRGAASALLAGAGEVLFWIQLEPTDAVSRPALRMLGKTHAPLLPMFRHPAACWRRLLRGDTASRWAVPRGRCRVE